MKKPSLYVLVVCSFMMCVATGRAVPVTLSLDNPNQSVAAPSSGSSFVNFSGTVVIDPEFHILSAAVDFAYNNSLTNFLSPTLNSAFLTFVGAQGSGTYTGSIFSVAVPAGTPPDLYSVNVLHNPSLLTIFVAFGGGNIISGENISASQAFSVLVTNGNQVPESGSTMWLLGGSAVGLCCVRRLFA